MTANSRLEDGLGSLRLHRPPDHLQHAALQIGEHALDEMGLDIDADGIPRAGVEDEHDGLAAAAGLPLAGLHDELPIQQVLDERGDGSFVESALFRYGSPGQRGEPQDGIQHDAGIDAPDHGGIAGSVYWFHHKTPLPVCPLTYHA